MTPHVWVHREAMALAEADSEYRRLIAGNLGIAATPKALRARLGDPAWVAEELRRLPPACLGVLEVLVEVGGSVSVEALARGLSDRSRGALRRPVALEAAKLAAGRGLVLLLSEPGASEPTAIALTAESAAAVAERVYGISLPVVPPAAPGGPPASPDTVDERDVAVVLGSTAHHRVRLTRSWSPHGSDSKKLAQALGLDPRQLYETLIEGVEDRVIGGRAGAMTPLLRGLERRFGGTEPRGVLAPWVAADWRSCSALLRARVRWLLDEHGGGGGHWTLPGLLEAGRVAMRDVADLESSEMTRVGDADWVRRRALVDAGGDGHVTSSFEVMLGPGASPSLAARLALACVPRRVDRVVTLDLTPDSIGAAIAAGLRGDDILGDLEAVGRRPPPDNVAAMVRDWAGAARVARVWRGTLLQLPLDAVEGVAGHLDAAVLARPAPGVLVVDDSVEPEVLEAALRRGGVRVGGGEPLDRRGRGWVRGSSGYDRDEPGELSEPPVGPPPLPLEPTPDPQLRETWRSACAAGFAEARPAGGEIGFAEAFTALNGIGDGMPGAPAAVQHFMNRFLALARRHTRRMGGWLETLSEEDRLEALGRPDLTLALLVLAPKWQEHAIRQLGWAALEAAQQMPRTRWSPEGIELMELAASKTVSAFLDELADLPTDVAAGLEDDEDEEGALGGDAAERELAELLADPPGAERTAQPTVRADSAALPDPDAFPTMTPAQVAAALSGLRGGRLADLCLADGAEPAVIRCRIEKVRGEGQNQRVFVAPEDDAPGIVLFARDVRSVRPAVSREHDT